MSEKITVNVAVDVSAVQEATGALDALAAATDRASAALDRLFGRVENVATVEEIEHRIKNGARPSGHRFKL